MLKIYHNPRCSKSRQCLALINEAGADVEVVEYLKNPLTKAEMLSLFEELGEEEMKAIIRKGEADYKANMKGKELSADELAQALITYPKVMERPIVVKGGKAIICRPVEKVEEVL